MSDDDRLAQIKSRLAAATPGPWSWLRDEYRADGPRPVCRISCIEGDIALTYGNTHDADLIANAPGDLAWLIAEVERLREVASLWEQMANALVNLHTPRPSAVTHLQPTAGSGWDKGANSE